MKRFLYLDQGGRRHGLWHRALMSRHHMPWRRAICQRVVLSVVAADVAHYLGAKDHGAELDAIDLGAEGKYLYPLAFFPEVPSILSPSSRLFSPLPLAEPSESRN